MSEKAPAEYLVRQASSRVPRPPGQQPSPCRRGRDEGFHRGPPSHRRTVEVLLIASLYVEAGELLGLGAATPPCRHAGRPPRL